MAREGRVLLVVLWILCTVVCMQGQGIRKNPLLEPSDFYPDAENAVFQDAKPPSDAVLDAVLESPAALEMTGEIQNFSHEELRALFRVVEVHLADPEEIDAVVLGKPPMSGVDNDWFWIVRERGGRADVLLWAGGNGLSVLKRRTRGYKDISTTWSSAAGYSIETRYRYDGTVYKKVNERKRALHLLNERK